MLVARRTDRLEQIASRYDGFEVLLADLFEPSGIDAVNDRIARDESPPIAREGGRGGLGEAAVDRAGASHGALATVGSRDL